MRLTGQAALCGWSVYQEKEVVRAILIAKMRYKDIPRELCFRPGNTPEETLKSALLQEKGAQTATSLQKQLGSSVASSLSHQGSYSAQNFRIKQATTYSVSEIVERINRAQSNSSRSKGVTIPKTLSLAFSAESSSLPTVSKYVRQGTERVAIEVKRGTLRNVATLKALPMWTRNQTKLLRRAATSILLIATQSLQYLLSTGSPSQTFKILQSQPL